MNTNITDFNKLFTEKIQENQISLLLEHDLSLIQSIEDLKFTSIHIKRVPDGTINDEIYAYGVFRVNLCINGYDYSFLTSEGLTYSEPAVDLYSLTTDEAYIYNEDTVDIHLKIVNRISPIEKLINNGFSEKDASELFVVLEKLGLRNLICDELIKISYDYAENIKRKFLRDSLEAKVVIKENLSILIETLDDNGELYTFALNDYISCLLD